MDDDPLSGDNVLGLIKTLPVGQRQTAIKFYRGLNDPDLWFITFAETLLLVEDAQTLRTLIEIHREVMPDDENLEAYETALEELEQDLGER